MHEATVIDADTIEFNNLVVAAGVGVSTARLVMYAPRELTAYAARMQVRPSAESQEVLLSLTSPIGGITIDDAAYKTTVVVPPSDTETASWFNGVYDVEFVSSTGEVFRVVQGDVILEKEVTR